MRPKLTVPKAAYLSLVPQVDHGKKCKGDVQIIFTCSYKIYIFNITSNQFTQETQRPCIGMAREPMTSGGLHTCLSKEALGANSPNDQPFCPFLPIPSGMWQLKAVRRF